MIKQRLSRQWYFQYAGADTWQTVDIPHDYMISLPRDPKASDGSRNGFFPVADGRYVKYIHTPDSSHAILDLDGAYMCAHIKINENLEGIHPYGYAPFLVELSGKLRPDEINKIEIDTSVMMRSTRWYTGGGLCRDVFLWTGGTVRIEPRDIFVRTSGVSETGANVQMEAVVTSDIRAKVELRVSIRGTEEQLSGTGNQEILVQPGQRHPVKMNFQIESPRVWSTEEPHLDHLTAEILWEDKVEDTTELDFGVRTLQVDARAGLRLNGISVKLRGGCIHHDHGALGAAAFPEAEERKVRLLKAAGFNAIRIAHNPPSLALLEICDRVGMLVMDEAFDMWNQPKNPGDYHLWFADWWERDLTAMVLRDRNHPCVISYSIGNEIEERDGNSDGAVWSVRLAKKVKELDPTRPVTAAVCSIWDRPEVIDPKEYRKNRHEEDPNADSWEKRTEGFLAPLDIVGYNYLYERYEQDHERYPERVMWGSETHTLHFYDSWKLVEEHPYVLGDFTWTAFDNLGEAGAGRGIWERDGVIRGLSRGGYPWRSCWQGDFDLCGYRRPQSYFREAEIGRAHV